MTANNCQELQVTKSVDEGTVCEHSFFSTFEFDAEKFKRRLNALKRVGVDSAC